jgi:hypothetical protein
MFTVTPSYGFLSQVWILQVLGLGRGFLPHTRMEEQPWFLFTFSTLIILSLLAANGLLYISEAPLIQTQIPDNELA